MDKSYTTIDKTTAQNLSLIMTDVDGTLLESGLHAAPDVADAIRKLQASGLTVGLVSGRTLRELEEMAAVLAIDGPVIAENGAIAKENAGADPYELGYTRKAAEDAFRTLNELFPGAIHGREDNADRTIDIVFRTDGISSEEIRKHIGATQFLDSGYIMHLMQPGIDKGNTLVRVVEEMLPKKYRRDEVMVFGDSATDISLFELFPNGVLIRNPKLPKGQPELVREKARYISEREYGEGFIEVALHIVSLRNGNVNR